MIASGETSGRPGRATTAKFCELSLESIGEHSTDVYPGYPPPQGAQGVPPPQGAPPPHVAPPVPYGYPPYPYYAPPPPPQS